MVESAITHRGQLNAAHTRRRLWEVDDAGPAALQEGIVRTQRRMMRRESRAREAHSPKDGLVLGHHLPPFDIVSTFELLNSP